MFRKQPPGRYENEAGAMVMLGNDTREWERIIQLHKAMPRIRSLELVGMWGLPVDFFAHATCLTSLYLDNCLDGTCFPPSIKACTKLEKLSLDRVCGAHNVQAVALVPRLEDLSISQGPAYPAIFTNASFALTSLDLYECKAPNRACMESLTSLKRLNVIGVAEYVQIDAQFWDLPLLITLRGCGVEFTHSKPRFDRFSKLQEIYLMFTCVCPEDDNPIDLQHITHLSSLRDLCIEEHVDLVALPAGISSLTGLTSFWWMDNQLDHYSRTGKNNTLQLPSLANLQQLQKIALPVCSEDGLRQLHQQVSQLSSLKKIKLWFAGPESEQATVDTLVCTVNKEK
jgi:hypothetical protein